MTRTWFYFRVLSVFDIGYNSFVSLPWFNISHYIKLKISGIGFNFITIHFVNTEGDTEQQNMCLHRFTEFCWTTLLLQGNNSMNNITQLYQSAYIRHLQWGKTYFNNYFRSNNPFLPQIRVKGYCSFLMCHMWGHL